MRSCSISQSQAHGFTTLFVLFKWDLQDAMKDYPEDQHLLSRKAAKAKKEAAAKQAAAKPKVLKSEDVSRFIFFLLKVPSYSWLLLQVIFDVCPDPKFLKTVIKYLPENFKLSKELVGASGNRMNRIKHVATIEN